MYEIFNTIYPLQFSRLFCPYFRVYAVLSTAHELSMTYAYLLHVQMSTFFPVCPYFFVHLSLFHNNERKNVWEWNVVIMCMNAGALEQSLKIKCMGLVLSDTQMLFHKLFCCLLLVFFFFFLSKSCWYVIKTFYSF